MNKKSVQAAAAGSLAAAVFVCDQIAKKKAQSLRGRKPVKIGSDGKVIPEGSEEKPILKLRYYQNSGMAMSFLENRPEVVRTLSTVMTGAVAGGFAAALQSDGKIGRKIGLSLLLGGALSNTLDRARQGSVTDYASVCFGPERMQDIVFNIGDAAILAGSVLLGQSL